MGMFSDWLNGPSPPDEDAVRHDQKRVEARERMDRARWEAEMQFHQFQMEQRLREQTKARMRIEAMEYYELRYKAMCELTNVPFESYEDYVEAKKQSEY